MVKIKALSLSGGSYLGFYMLGALKHSFESGFIDYHNLKHIYGISVGSIMGVFTAMNMDWNMLTDYAIERPWHKLFGIKTSNIMNCIDNNGMYNIGQFYKAIDPVFNVFLEKHNVEDRNFRTITMKEFYDITQIHLHFYATSIEERKMKEFSHILTPDCPLARAIYMSSTLPFIFEPSSYNDEYYLDGGLINASPLNIALDEREKYEFDENNIMSFQFNKEKTPVKYNPSIPLQDYLFLITRVYTDLMEQEDPELLYKLSIDCEDVNISDAIDIISDESRRKNAIDYGKKTFMDFCIKQKNINAVEK